MRTTPRGSCRENSRELDRVIHGYPAELCVRHCACIDAQAKDSGILIRERLRQGGAVGEVLVQNLLQLGVRDAQPLAPDGSHRSDGGVIECIAKGISADHSSRSHDHNTLLSYRKAALAHVSTCDIWSKYCNSPSLAWLQQVEAIDLPG